MLRISWLIHFPKRWYSLMYHN